MATILALENLYDAVAASFTADAINATNAFGWREPTKHAYGARIAWVPGDQSGDLGTIGGPRGPGQIPRALAMLNERCTLYISAQNEADPENERVQYHVVRQLYDAWVRAAYLAAHGTWLLVSQAWLTERSERRHGATLRVVFELQAPIVDALPDAPLTGDGVPLTDQVDARQTALDEHTTLGADLTARPNDSNTPTSDDETIVIPPGSVPND